MYMYVCMFVCMYVCVYMGMYMYGYTYMHVYVSTLFEMGCVSINGCSSTDSSARGTYFGSLL